MSSKRFIFVFRKGMIFQKRDRSVRSWSGGGMDKPEKNFLCIGKSYRKTVDSYNTLVRENGVN